MLVSISFLIDLFTLFMCLFIYDLLFIVFRIWFNCYILLGLRRMFDGFMKYFAQILKQKPTVLQIKLKYLLDINTSSLKIFSYISLDSLMRPCYKNMKCAL